MLDLMINSKYMLIIKINFRYKIANLLIKIKPIEFKLDFGTEIKNHQMVYISLLDALYTKL